MQNINYFLMFMLLPFYLGFILPGIFVAFFPALLLAGYWKARKKLPEVVPPYKEHTRTPRAA